MSFASFLVRRSRWLCVLVVALLFAARIPAATDPDNPEIRDAVSDGTGLIWGIDEGNRSGLFVLDANTRWQPATPPGLPQGAEPVCLGVRADGVVVCLWRGSDMSFRCSEHRGQDARVHEWFSLPGNRTRRNTRLTGDSQGDMWLTMTEPQIYRLKPDGIPECMHTITEEECVPSDERGSGMPARNMVSVFEGADHRRWFWANSLSGTVRGLLRGALVYDGTSFVQHDFLTDGKKLGALSLLAPKDAQHLWFGLSGEGLYTLDTRTFQAERVPDQPGEASYTSRVERGHRADWYFVMGQARPSGGGTLWRLGADARWEKLIDGVDARFDYHDPPDRPWAWTDHGAYLGTNENGLWFLPGDGQETRHLDWRQQFPMRTPRRFFNLPDSRWLGIGETGPTWTGEPGALLAGHIEPTDPAVGILRTRAPLRADSHRHLWSLFDNHFSSLHEWDGDRWIEHPFPPGLNWEPYAELLNVDQRGRPWVRFFSRPDHTLIYDPATDHWDVFESFRAALEAQGGRHDAEFAPWNGAFDLARFGSFDLPRSGPFELPRFGPDGRICYLDGTSIEVFEGHVWRQWSAEVVTGRKNGGFKGAPFFNRAGQLSVNEYHRTLACVDGSRWQETAFEPGPADIDALARLRRPLLPSGLALPFQPVGRAVDNQGMCWLTDQGVLYRARDDRWAPVFTPGMAQPYLDGRGLGGAFVDGRGNTFLCSDDADPGEYVIIGPPGPPPRTTLAEDLSVDPAAPTPPERVLIRLTTSARPVAGKLRFLWRLDEGPWTPLAVEGSTGTVTFDDLPGGSHRFEARSFDPTLQTDAAPAGLTFEIHLASRAQVAGYIAQLADPDFSRRKAAVTALARQPGQVIPILQAARMQTADDSQRWWIDAALQQIETTRRAAGVQDGLPGG